MCVLQPRVHEGGSCPHSHRSTCGAQGARNEASVGSSWGCVASGLHLCAPPSTHACCCHASTCQPTVTAGRVPAATPRRTHLLKQALDQLGIVDEAQGLAARVQGALLGQPNHLVHVLADRLGLGLCGAGQGAEAGRVRGGCGRLQRGMQWHTCSGQLPALHWAAAAAPVPDSTRTARGSAACAARPHTAAPRVPCCSETADTAAAPQRQLPLWSCSRACRCSQARPTLALASVSASCLRAAAATAGTDPSWACHHSWPA